MSEQNMVVYYSREVVKWAMNPDAYACKTCREQLLTYLTYLNGLACSMCRSQDSCIRFHQKDILK